LWTEWPPFHGGLAHVLPSSAQAGATVTRVKICGIRTLEQATLALEAGADYLGFIFYPPSHRYVAPEHVGAIVEACRARFAPGTWSAVGVFVDVPLEDARRICTEAQVDLA